MVKLSYLSKKLAFLVTSNVLGNLKLKFIRQFLIIDMLFVLNNFNKKRLTTKSKDFMSDFFRQQACRIVGRTDYNAVLPGEYHSYNEFGKFLMFK